ncbi:MAG: hypothetical protein AMXMBFR82_17480 [Candidatus Hydrogenedentota bacterium]
MYTTTGTQAMSRTHRVRGFTLVELLIATALFSIIMAAIVTLFVASLHAVKSAYLASDAYETSRGAFAVVERDLTTVFTMRDYGDYYQFYGTPQGMSMIGLVRDPDGGSTTLGRITYVMLPVVIKNSADTFAVTDPFNLPQLNTRPVPIQMTNDGGTPADPLDDTVDDFFVGTAALVRFVEPGVEDLDTYPFDWDELNAAFPTNPELPVPTIAEQLDAATGVTNGWSDVNRRIRLTPAEQELLAAKKRELWISMLSAQDFWTTYLTFGQEVYPNAWGYFDRNGDPVRGWLVPRDNFDNDGDGFVDEDDELILDPRDYVVAENIGLVTPINAAHFVPLYPMQSFHPLSDPVRSLYPINVQATLSTQVSSPISFGNLTVKTYVNGVFDTTTDIPISPTMSLEDLLDRFNYDFPGDPDDVPGVYAVVNGGTIEIGPEQYYNPVTGDPDPSVQFSFTFGNDTSGVLRALGLYGQFFRYGRVLATSELDVRSSWNSALNVGTTANVGNPLTPRLPEIVALRLPFAYERPYPTAPQFERNLEQVIDVPTAYSRSALGGA